MAKALSAREESQKRWRRLPKEKRESDIIAAAKEAFCEFGFEETSMAHVASKADVVEGSVYRHFASKRELLLSVIERTMEQAMSDYDRRLAGISGTKNRLRFMIWHHLDVLHQNPEICNLLIKHVRYEEDYEETKCFALNQAYTEHTIEIIREGIANGEFRTDTDLRVVRDMIYGGSEYYSWRFLTGRTSEFDVEAAADAITNHVYRGIAASPAEADGPADRLMSRFEKAIQKMETLLPSDTRDPNKNN